MIAKDFYIFGNISADTMIYLSNEKCDYNELITTYGYCEISVFYYDSDLDKLEIYLKK